MIGGPIGGDAGRGGARDGAVGDRGSDQPAAGVSPCHAVSRDVCKTIARDTTHGGAYWKASLSVYRKRAVYDTC